MSSAAESLAVAVKEQEEGLQNCVHCGFCLPACPTYRRLGDEADSPRGRLYLMQAVVEGRLKPGSDAFGLHIDRCLGCRACEPVCPSGVAYGHLLELARQVRNSARTPPLTVRLLLRVFGTAWIRIPLMLAARALRATRLPTLFARLGSPARKPGRLRMSLAMLAASAPTRLPRPSAASVAEPTGGVSDRPSPKKTGQSNTVGVLTGCVQEGLFARVNRATVRVLRQNDYEVVSVPGQRCCGALHAHAGDLETARSLARRNVVAFEAAGVDFLAMNASGCGATVASYGSLLAHDRDFADRAERIGARVRDMSQLLAQRGPVAGASIPLRVTYDAPCHLHHGLKVDGPPEVVVGAVPGVELVPLAGASECCGGAGIYGLTQRELGGWIGGDKVRSVIETGTSVLLTGNPGCIMQIGAGLRLARSKVMVLHPAELLDKSYALAGLYEREAR